MMSRPSSRCLALVLPLAFLTACADREIGPTIDTPPVLVPTVVAPPPGQPGPTQTVALVRCDDGGDAGGVIVDGVCV